MRFKVDRGKCIIDNTKNESQQSRPSREISKVPIEYEPPPQSYQLSSIDLTIWRLNTNTRFHSHRPGYPVQVQRRVQKPLHHVYPLRPHRPRSHLLLSRHPRRSHYQDGSILQLEGELSRLLYVRSEGMGLTATSVGGMAGAIVTSPFDVVKVCTSS